MPWMAMVGATLLFGSWVLQNFLEDKWQAEMDDMQRALVAMAMEEGKANDWMIALMQEQRNEQPDDEIISEAAIRAALHTASVLASAEYRITSDKELVRQNRQMFGDQANALYIQGKTIELLEVLYKLKDLEKRYGPGIQADFVNKYREVKMKKQYARNTFLVLYVLGSVLLGGAYLCGQWKKGQARRA